MHADLSRATFRPERRYSSVVAQQGRVQLDADLNEQTAIALHRSRRTAADLIGAHGGPRGADGFAIGYVAGGGDLDSLTIGGGRYYVDGVLVDATRPDPGTPVPDEADDGGSAPPPTPDTWTYWDQPDAHRDQENPGDRLPAGVPYVVYLAVRERLVTAAEEPALREVALGAAVPDTSARTKVTWQVLPLPASELDLSDDAPDLDDVREAFQSWAENRGRPASRLAARSERPDRAGDDPCLVRPDARYRGPENQLYRVEVHEGGDATEATVKWSRENGSVTFPVDEVDGTWLELAALGSDDTLDVHVGDWVEVLDTAVAERQEAHPLLRVEEVDVPERRVRLSDEPHGRVGRRPGPRPFLRRWDHRGTGRSGGGGRTGRSRLVRGAVPVEEGTWLPLEDGVEVYFAAEGRYRTGEYWLIPARAATGAVDWPADPADRPLLRAPDGDPARFAPLAWIGNDGETEDLRQVFAPLAAAVPSTGDAAARAAAYEEHAERAAARARQRAADRSDGDDWAANDGPLPETERAGTADDSADSGAAGPADPGLRG